MQAFPEHGILGEEYGKTTEDADYIWVIDPIDGTRAFIAGLPTWGILLGLMHRGKPILGMMYQPFTDELYMAHGDNAWLMLANSSRELKTSEKNDLSAAILLCTHPDIFKSEAEFVAFSAVSSQCRMTRYGGDCYNYCLLASGYVDLVIESDLQIYDIQPLIPIVEAAGGMVTDASGRKLSTGGFVVAAANPSLHKIALGLINEHLS